MALTNPPDVVYALRALGLGDLLTAVPALRGLRRHYPDARLVLAAPEQYRELALLTGAVDEVVPTAGLGDLTPLRRPPALAVNLHGRGPQSVEHLLALAPAALLSHRHPQFPDLAGPPWRDDVHEVDRWCILLNSAGIASDPDDLYLDRPEGYPVRSGAVVVHPGAAAAARRWPATRFAEIAAALHAAGHEVLVTGTAEERNLACEVAAGAGLPESAVLAGELELLQLVALIADCRLVICGDTGVGHVATATRTPSVLLFGPTPPSRWGPRDGGRHVALWAGATGDPHGECPDAGLLAIATSDVLDATRSMLRRCAWNGVRVGVVGAGYVGLTTAVCFGERGIDVVSVDVDRAKVDRLDAGHPTIDEPGLAEALRAGLARGTLRFTVDAGSLADRDVVFVCVPTPSAADGSADLGAVESVVELLGEVLSPGAVVAVKSTVPVGTTRRLSERLQHRGIHAVSNPEFLREGHAVDDFRHPDRLVVGADDEAAADAVCRAHGAHSGAVLRMSPESAEVAKYASNAFLAVKSSYANSLAALCTTVGDSTVAVAMAGAVRHGQMEHKEKAPRRR